MDELVLRLEESSAMNAILIEQNKRMAEAILTAAYDARAHQRYSGTIHAMKYLGIQRTLFAALEHRHPEGGGVTRCEDCGLDYTKFPLDVLLPDEQWEAITGRKGPGAGGILCAMCMVKRGALLPGVTCAFLHFPDLGPPRQERDVELEKSSALSEGYMTKAEP